MKSTLAADLRREQIERFAAMSAAERVALAMRLGDEGLASYMALHCVDRPTAVARIRATRRAGRRPWESDSGCGAR